jgi:N-acetylglucosamine-6-phosphate deacetylase
MTLKTAVACRHYRTGEVLMLEAGALRAPAAGERTETDLLLAPALVDIQINGYKGISFYSGNLTPEEVNTVFDEIAATGAAYFCPTVTTNSPRRMLQGLQAIEEACRRYPEVARMNIGYHLEGPWISAEEGPRGAHPQEWARDPSWEEFQAFQEASNGRVKIVSMAPEREGAIPFMAKLASAGIVAAIGHAAPTTEQVTAAADAGATLATHLGNGAHAMLPRHPNYIWDMLAEDRLSASIIADGFHLPPSVVKVMARAKGLQRTILISDVLQYSGMPPGIYPLDENRSVEVAKSGRIGLHGTPFLSGANATVDECVGNIVRFAGIELADAIDMASVNAWRLLGKEPPTLAAGAEPHAAMLCRWQEGKLTVAEIIW